MAKHSNQIALERFIAGECENKGLGVENSPLIWHCIACEVLNGTNTQAAEILRSCDLGECLYPDIDWMARKGISVIYGVSEGYVDRLIGRFHISSASMPADFHVGYLEDLIVATRNTENYETVEQGVYRHKPTGAVFEPGESRYCRYISARLVVAFAALMCGGRSIPAESKAKLVYERLLNSGFHEAALRRREALLSESSSSTDSIGSTEAQSAATIPISKAGDITISPELLSRVSARGFKDALSELIWDDSFAARLGEIFAMSQQRVEE